MRLQRIFSNSPTLCYKCKTHKGASLFWSCDCIQTFWKGVHSVIQEITGKQFALSPSFCLLNHTPGSHFTYRYQLSVDDPSIAGKKNVSHCDDPTVDMWISQISALFLLEKLTHDLNHKPDKLWRLWKPLHSFLQKLWLARPCCHAAALLVGLGWGFCFAHFILFWYFKINKKN